MCDEKLGEEMVLYLCIGMEVFIALLIINETEVLFHKKFTVIRAARVSEMSAILENQEKHLHLLLTNDEDRFFFLLGLIPNDFIPTLGCISSALSTNASDPVRYLLESVYSCDEA